MALIEKIAALASPVGRGRAMAFAALLLAATMPTPTPTPSPTESSPEPPAIEAPALSRTEGWPGDTIVVTFPSRADICWAGFDDGERIDCGYDVKRNRVSTLTVPRDARPGTHRIEWFHDTIRVSAAAEPVPLAFEVKQARFEARPSTITGVPGNEVTVVFTSLTDGVLIQGCQIRLRQVGGDCEFRDDRWTATTVVPPTGSKEPLDTEIAWTVRYSAGDNHEGEVPGAERFRIDPLPPPRFTVEANRKTVGPGESVEVHFAAATGGVTVEGCSVTLTEPIPCDLKTLTATVPIPANQSQGALTLTWNLTYVSTRPGESQGSDEGDLPVEVVWQPRQFVVTIQPGAAAPGEWVTLTVTSATEGVEIVGCMAFFPKTVTESLCRKSSKRWFTRVRVPFGTAPGVAVLRWGISARTAAGADIADNGTLDYTVQPPRSGGGTGPTVDPTGSATTRPVADEDFYAATDPESARPGDRVVVAVSPARPGVRVGGCRVAFSGRGTACRPAVGGWTATVTVPRGASAGSLPLRWEATDEETGGQGGGTIDYEVLGAAPPAAAFSVLPDPAAAVAGQTVKLTLDSLVEGVEILGCSAGFTAEGMSSCHRTGEGWVAELLIPVTTEPGKTKVMWQLTYQRAGAEQGAANGLTLFSVLPPEPVAGPWDKVRGLLSRGLLGALVVVAPFAFAPVRRRIGKLFHRDDPGDDETAGELTAVVAEGRSMTAVTERDHPAVDLVSITPAIDPTLHEEVP
ncbi:hypothetical protein JIG36_05025 [Actinoplanes sp. LDG1-06]|uniref:Uncharacterized protein n=1 Tax=Paractinoplanes ovalisporus TaxID=2810368 RepID=A0ABS2A500_9ACTN|nr:hypothetical protein [Actinoplanes ovalisporus]MBM2614920.1 hypothetical protein [Actinoplanes ovalisporus]